MRRTDNRSAHTLPSSLSSTIETASQSSIDSYDSFMPSSQLSRHVMDKENSLFGGQKTISQRTQQQRVFAKPLDPVSCKPPVESSQPCLSPNDSWPPQTPADTDVSPTTQMKRARFQESDFLKSTNPSSSLLMPKLNSSEFATHFQNTLTTQQAVSQNTQRLHDMLGSYGQARPANSFYGLPARVKELLKQLRNISSLYEWQDELLNIMADKYEVAWNNLHEHIDDDLHTNLLYLSPTSAGKTLVAEMIILHCLLVRRTNCIFIMPFVSIVQEKVQAIAEFAEALHFGVEEYAGVKGRVPPIKRQRGGKCTLYVCTIEKAHALVNSLIETDRLADELGLVVADELHMIGDGSRGAIYEMTLSKINYCSEQILIQNKLVCVFFVNFHRLKRLSSKIGNSRESFFKKSLVRISVFGRLVVEKVKICRELVEFGYLQPLNPFKLFSKIKPKSQKYHKID